MLGNFTSVQAATYGERRRSVSRGVAGNMKDRQSHSSGLRGCGQKSRAINQRDLAHFNTLPYAHSARSPNTQLDPASRRRRGFVTLILHGGCNQPGVGPVGRVSRAQNGRGLNRWSSADGARFISVSNRSLRLEPVLRPPYRPGPSACNRTRTRSSNPVLLWAYGYPSVWKG